MLPSNPALRRRALVALLLCGACTCIIATIVGTVLHTTSYVSSVAAVFIGASVLILGGVEGSHPFDVFGAANVVTTVRLALVALVAGLVVAPATAAAAWAAALVSLTAVTLDGVDGWLARRSGLASAFGARFDMETDALLILVLAIVAWRHERAGAWIVLAGAMRYLFVAAGYVWTWMNGELPPSLRRKTVCVLQIGGLCAVVAPVLAAPVALVIAGGTLAALSWSFGVDVMWLKRHGA